MDYMVSDNTKFQYRKSYLEMLIERCQKLGCMETTFSELCMFWSGIVQFLIMKVLLEVICLSVRS